MDHRIDTRDERKIARAVEKAATLVSSDGGRDCSRTLAGCLLEEDVDSRFAKTASAAFNRRLTVLKFQKTADEHKPDSFPLADPGTVLECMGCRAPQRKTASINPPQGGFRIGLVSSQPPVMRKVASAAVPRKPLYEDRVRWEDYERHLESMLQKHAAAHSTLMGDLHSLEGEVHQLREEVAEELRKSAAFVRQNMYGLFGDRLTCLVEDRLPEAPFEKRASQVVDPDTPLSRKIRDMLDKTARYEALHDAIADYQHGLAEFGESAARLSRGMRKVAVGSPGLFLGGLIRGGSALGLTGAQQALKISGAFNTEYANQLSNARDMYRAGTERSRSYSPASVIDTSFLLKDRYRDRMLAWSDMSADDLFKNYPAEQVFYVTQKAMDIDPMLESASKRELLRTTVGQLLAQNNRTSTADMAALAQTLKGFAASRPSPQMQALQAVRALNDAAAPDYPEFRELAFHFTPKDRDFGSEASKSVEEARKRVADEMDRREKKDKEQSDADKKMRDDAVAAANNAAAKEIARRKEVLGFAKSIGLKPTYNAVTGEIELVAPGGSKTEYTVVPMGNIEKAYEHVTGDKANA